MFVIIGKLLVVRGKLAGVQVLLVVLTVRSSCSKPAALQCAQPISGAKHSAEPSVHSALHRQSVLSSVSWKSLGKGGEGPIQSEMLFGWRNLVIGL